MLRLVILGTLLALFSTQELNDRPIIGILSQKPSDSMLEGNEDQNYTAYIAASYVKFMESAGARVVPIMIYEEEGYYDYIIDSVNGILFPGGSSSITNTSGYGMAGQFLYDKVLEKNKNGTFMPLWATCLGFEMLLYLAAGFVDFRHDCNAQNLAIPLIPIPGYSDSELFGNMPNKVFDLMTTENVTVNFHCWCYTNENFTDLGLDNEYKVLTKNYDFDDQEFISTVEHLQLPIYGTQWHPEKNAYEWKNDESHDQIPHNIDAIFAVQYLADFFVEKARYNSQRFPSFEEEENALIYAYAPTYVANTSSSFTQVYFFKN